MKKEQDLRVSKEEEDYDFRGIGLWLNILLIMIVMVFGDYY